MNTAKKVFDDSKWVSISNWNELDYSSLSIAKRGHKRMFKAQLREVPKSHEENTPIKKVRKNIQQKLNAPVSFIEVVLVIIIALATLQLYQIYWH